MRHLAYGFLLKQKQFVWNNTVYTLYDAALAIFRPTFSLHCVAHGNALPLVFLDTVITTTLQIWNPVSLPLLVANMYDAESCLFGNVTPISETAQDYALIFGSASLNNASQLLSVGRLWRQHPGASKEGSAADRRLWRG